MLSQLPHRQGQHDVGSEKKSTAWKPTVPSEPRARTSSECLPPPRTPGVSGSAHGSRTSFRTAACRSLEPEGREANSGRASLSRLPRHFPGLHAAALGAAHWREECVSGSGGRSASSSVSGGRGESVGRGAGEQGELRPERRRRRMVPRGSDPPGGGDRSPGGRGEAGETVGLGSQ